MKFLIINSGSSSIKYKLFRFPQEDLIDSGDIERVGEPSSGIKDHNQGVKAIIKRILSGPGLSSLDEIDAIGHRVVHGGEKFKEPRLIDSKVIKQIEKCIDFAPLHNPANLAGIKQCLKSFPTDFQVAVFDTAFYQMIPDYSCIYPLPYIYYKKYKIRKYGFHGTSHQFVSLRAAKLLKKPLSRLKLITIHLGNGCSMTALNKGRPIDTSMGFTPLEGLMMGTRCGDLDVAAVFNVMKKEGLNIDQMDKILNKKSGFLGVSGLSNDFRAIKKAACSGNKRAKLAVQIFLHRIKKYTGAYFFLLRGVDAVCVTGGIGENNPEIARELRKSLKKIAPKVKVLVIPTNEELMIAKLVQELFKKKKKVN